MSSSRTQYRGQLSFTYCLKYGQTKYNVSMVWFNAHVGYQIDKVTSCTGNCNLEDFPYRVTKSDLFIIEQLMR